MIQTLEWDQLVVVLGSSYTGICSYSQYVSNTGYHSIYIGISLLNFCELEGIQVSVNMQVKQ